MKNAGNLYVGQTFLDRFRPAARGSWKRILQQLGVPEDVIESTNKPCPFCGGEDRFSFTDKFGNGDSFCRKCGAHDGFELVMHFQHCGFRQALELAAEVLGMNVPKHQSVRRGNKGRRIRHCDWLWNKARELTASDESTRYLLSRGLEGPWPASLRHVSGLRYEQQSTLYEGLVAEVLNAEGRRSSLLRIYLTDGRKADVPAPKKLLPGEVAGCAVRLGEIGKDGLLGVAEGIETALSASKLFGMPVWSLLFAGNFRHFELPEAVRKLVIFSDSDASFTGQKEAYALAARIRAQRPDVAVEVLMPTELETDWNDVLLEQKRSGCLKGALQSAKIQPLAKAELCRTT